MGLTTKPPYDRTAERPQWADLAREVWSRVAELAGSPVVAVVPAGGGFTRGFAGLLTLADGTEVFVKAASDEDQPVAARSYRAEVEVLRVLPAAVPAPRLLWSSDQDGWVVLGVTPVRAARMPGLPWTPPDLAAAVAACEQSAAALGAPPAGLRLPRLVDDMGDDQPWLRWYDDVARGERSGALLSPWGVAQLSELHRLTRLSGTALDGDAACHGDLRPDNLLVDDAGRAWVCDWNWLSLGAAWTDLVGLLVTVHADGLDADAALRGSWLSHDVDDKAVDVWLAVIGAFMLGGADQPQPDFASSWLGPHRTYFGSAALSWLEHRRAR